MARAMASRTPPAASSSSCTRPPRIWTAQYAAFGKVTEGMDVVDTIARIPHSDYSDRPLHEQKIKSITVETFGVDYPEPEKR